MFPTKKHRVKQYWSSATGNEKGNLRSMPSVTHPVYTLGDETLSVICHLRIKVDIDSII
jgi:hypothetical protein